MLVFILKEGNYKEILFSINFSLEFIENLLFCVVVLEIFICFVLMDIVYKCIVSLSEFKYCDGNFDLKLIYVD